MVPPRVRKRPRKTGSNARSWETHLSRDALHATVRNLLSWAVAFCESDAGPSGQASEAQSFRAAEVLRTREMLTKVVWLLSQHEARWRQRVREARIATLVPRLFDLLQVPPRDDRDEVDAAALQTRIADMFREQHVLVHAPAVAAVAALAAAPRRHGDSQRSQKAIAEVLKAKGAVGVGGSTMANYRYAGGGRAKPRKGSAVRTQLAKECLEKAWRVESVAMMRFALLSLTEKDAELADGLLAEVEKYLPKVRPQKQWF